MEKILQTREISFLEFTDEEMEELKMKKGDKFTMEDMGDGSIKMTPYEAIEIDFEAFSKEALINLVIGSHERGETIEEYITYILDTYIKNEDQLEFGF